MLLRTAWRSCSSSPFQGRCVTGFDRTDKVYRLGEMVCCWAATKVPSSAGIERDEQHNIPHGPGGSAVVRAPEQHNIPHGPGGSAVVRAPEVGFIDTREKGLMFFVSKRPMDYRTTAAVYYDGGARGNPGPSGAGAVVYSDSTTSQMELGHSKVHLGIATNNEAEYAGMISGLVLAVEMGLRRIEIIGDSKLLTRQMQGAYKVSASNLRPLHTFASKLLLHFEKCVFRHVPRDMNERADALANMAIDEMSPSRREAFQATRWLESIKSNPAFHEDTGVSISPKKKVLDNNVGLIGSVHPPGVRCSDFKSTQSYSDDSKVLSATFATGHVDYIVIDTETTSLTGHVIQVGVVACSIDGKVLAQFSRSWKWDENLTRWCTRAEKVHGISRTVLKQIGIDTVKGIEELREILGWSRAAGCTIVAHNAAFDFSRINQTARDHGQSELLCEKLDSPFCTMLASRHTFGRRMKNEHLYQKLHGSGHEFGAAHNALIDARITAASFAIGKSKALW